MLKDAEENFLNEPDALSGYYGRRYSGTNPMDSEVSISKMSVRSSS